MDKLECLFCQKSFPLDIFFPFCPLCQEPLLCPDPLSNKPGIPKAFPTIKNWYSWLPLSTYNPYLSLGEGRSPLIRCGNLLPSNELPPVFFKNESFNPTASFKDRGTALAIQKAVSLGINKIGTVSTGNMAASTAAYGAKARITTYLLLKEDTSDQKARTPAVFGPKIFKVKADYGKLFTESYSLGKKHGIYFMNSVDPFRIEGYKITGFEIFRQLNNKAPDFIFVPLSSGGHLIGLIRAFQNLGHSGTLRKFPVFVGVQAEGCAPLVRAFERSESRFRRIPEGKTVAHSISNPDPPGGNIVLKLIQKNKGVLVSVSDEEILEAQKILAVKEGINCLPASAASLAGFFKLKTSGRIKKNHISVLIITGSGLKKLTPTDTSSDPCLSISLRKLDTVFSNERKIY
ncbi:MAG: threonine synthase [Candidatus Aminicenantes bacterium]|nr:threonine synthase [Candidatus Aminicenantes bacterium]